MPIARPLCPAPASSPNVAAAPSTPIAIAARAFGDGYPRVRDQWRVRAAGILLLVTSLAYLPWMLGALNDDAAWLAYPFAAANLFSIGYSMLTVVNAWHRRVPPRRPVPAGLEPHVGIIIPTCGETVPMILRTVSSVFDQDWPLERLTVVVSDDGHDPELAAALAGTRVVYHEPPPRSAPGRDGAAKAGNLNDALAMLDREHPGIAFIETRDADDEVGSHGFLRQTVGQLMADERLAYVQTIKEAQVSTGDPFNNRESMFYRGQMLSRHAANAVFPCGSGLVWRRRALHDIGEFPTWNLVEDLQSGVEALRRGWRGMYLPIVGAVGQHAPEDVPNVYKQRGTWAVDTVRLLAWGDLSGLGWRQRLHFLEMLLFYLNAFTALVYIPSIALSLLGWTPLRDTGLAYVSHMLPLVLAMEVWLLVVNHPFADRRRRQRHQLRALWRVRIMWTGMAPVYMRATVKALSGGRHRKPVYKVTRKEHDLRWHWRDTLPQALLVVVLVGVMLTSLITGSVPNFSLFVGAVYWGGMNVLLMAGFVSRGWHGVGHPAAAPLRRRHTRTGDAPLGAPQAGLVDVADVADLRPAGSAAA